MPNRLVVPDASVLLKWILRSEDEEPRDRALELKAAWLTGACEIVVPTLWVFEVGNVLGLKQAAQAFTLLQAMMDLQMPEETPAAYTADIFRLMRDHRVTCYDAAYHALAVRHGGTMVTADRRYVSKAGRAGHVQVIDDWRSPFEAAPQRQSGRE
jgi:predicted nucleic acid-binding protein